MPGVPLGVELVITTPGVEECRPAVSEASGSCLTQRGVTRGLSNGAILPNVRLGAGGLVLSAVEIKQVALVMLSCIFIPRWIQHSKNNLGVDL